jgi:CelD/BcsL family acetyltransferase involved in cellulose biosynthesis
LSVLAELLRVDELDEVVIEDWKRLAAAALESNPFCEPAFVLPALSHLSCPDSVRLLVVRGDLGLDACVPVCRGRLWRRLPMTGLSSWDHAYCYLGAPLVRADRSEEALGALLDGASSSGAAYLAFARFPVDGSLHAALSTAAAARGRTAVVDRPFQRAIARSASEATETINGRHRRELARLRRQLEAKLGGPALLVERGPEPADVEQFLAMEASGWKGPGGTGTAMAPAGHDQFFREICTGFGDEMAFQCLEVAGVTVAMLCTLRSTTTLFWFKIAVADEFSEWSPGIQLMLSVTESLGRRLGVGLIDSCANADNQTINRLWRGRRTLATAAVPLGGRLTGPARAATIGRVATRHQRRKA